MPKAFAIIPWKRSGTFAKTFGMLTGLMSQGHDIEVFMRLLNYEVRSEAEVPKWSADPK